MLHNINYSSLFLVSKPAVYLDDVRLLQYQSKKNSGKNNHAKMKTPSIRELMVENSIVITNKPK